MIKKPVRIITSLGRTGTLFFSELLSELIPQADVFHEVGYLNFGQYQGFQQKIKELVHQVNQIGFSNIIIKKFLGKWGLQRMSNSNFLNQLDQEKAVKNFINRRETFIENLNNILYIEASSEYYGLLNLFPKIFNDYSVVYIIRDGRDWVTSQMNFGRGGYEYHPLQKLVSPPFPNSDQVQGDEYFGKWQELSTFEQLSWCWDRLNRFCLDSLASVPNSRIFRFEDIFSSPDRNETITDLVNFLSSDTAIDHDRVEKWLTKPIHKSKKIFPAWTSWTETQSSQFHTMCGSLMEEVGYI